MPKYKVAVVGIGKISLDQHLPVIAKSGDFELVAVVSQRGVEVEGVPTFKTQAELFASDIDLDAIVHCTPPAVRHGLVREAIDAGFDVLMEKPPTPTISEFDDLVRYASLNQKVLFSTWHSRFNPAVGFVKNLLANDPPVKMRIDWCESVRKWHPGQEWIWEPGGFGVCDPGINSLSIATMIMPEPLFVESAVLEFPENRQTPIDVQIKFKIGGARDVDYSARFNWLEEDGEVWQIDIVTESGKNVKLEVGGSRLLIDGREIMHTNREEYELIYEKFAQMLNDRESDVDGSPLRIVSDAFLVGSRTNGPRFDW